MAIDKKTKPKPEIAGEVLSNLSNFTMIYNQCTTVILKRSSPVIFLSENMQTNCHLK